MPSSFTPVGRSLRGPRGPLGDIVVLDNLSTHKMVLASGSSRDDYEGSGLVDVFLAVQAALDPKGGRPRGTCYVVVVGGFIRVLLPIIVFARCGGLVSNSAGDAGSPEGSSHGPCDITAPFGAPVPIPGLGVPYENISLTSDELTAYVDVAYETPYNDVVPHMFVTHRPSIEAAFAAPEAVDGIWPLATAPSVSGDDTVLVWKGPFDMYPWPCAGWSQRPSPTAPFACAPPNIVLPGGGFLEGDGQAVYQGCAGPGICEIDWVVDHWSAQARTVLTMPLGSEIGRFAVSSDGLVIYYLYNPPGVPGMESLSVNVASRVSVTDPFGPSTIVPELSPTWGPPQWNSATAPVWLSKDRCRLYQEGFVMVSR